MRKVRFAAVLLGLVTFAPHTNGQGRRAMTIVDLAQLPRAADPQLSPDGRFVIYALSHADWSANRAVFQLWRQEVGRGAPPVQLTFSDGGITPGASRWSPDGRMILFLRSGQISLMSTEGGEPRELTHHATAITFYPAPSWSPDGSAVYFVAAEPRTAEERDRIRLQDDVFGLDENYQQRHLRKDVVSTSAEQRITSGDSSVLSYHVSNDGKQVALERAPTPLASDGFRGEVWAMDASGENARVLTHNDVAEDEPQFSPDNNEILFLADANPQLEPYYNTRLFKMPASGGAPKLVSPDFPYAFDRAAWAPDGGNIFAVANMGVHSEVFRIDSNGHGWKQLTDGTHAIPAAPAPAWSLEPRARQLVFLLDEPTRFGEVWTLALTGGEPVKITSVYDSFATDFALPRQEKVEWKSSDGVPVEGLIFYPADYQAGKRYPLIVQMHGGPQDADRFGAGTGTLLNYFPVLTGRGYLVLRPNYRGSIGYGDAFMRGIVGGYFQHQPYDIMAGVDLLIAQGIADPDRLIAMGWSAGGTLTNKLITFTDRFKAASVGAGVSNWISMYAQTDQRWYRTIWFNGTPWQRNAPVDLYWDNSPVKDAANAKTPTLFVAGDNDARVPLMQSMEMYRALKANNVPARLLVAPGEGHQWGSLRHLIFKANSEIEWFEKYAMGRTYVWEKPPKP